MFKGIVFLDDFDEKKLRKKADKLGIGVAQISTYLVLKGLKVLPSTFLKWEDEEKTEYLKQYWLTARGTGGVMEKVYGYLQAGPKTTPEIKEFLRKEGHTGGNIGSRMRDDARFEAINGANRKAFSAIVWHLTPSDHR